MEKLTIPAVGAIIERYNGAEKEILIQTRFKPKVSPKYSGLFEIPAGALREYENIYEGIKREIFEETGLEVLRVKEHPKSKTYKFHQDSGFAFRPFCCEYMDCGAPFLCVVFLVEVSEGELIPQKSEVRNPKWIKVSELRKLFSEHPEKFFTLHAGAIEFYLNEN